MQEHYDHQSIIRNSAFPVQKHWTCFVLQKRLAWSSDETIRPIWISNSSNFTCM